MATAVVGTATVWIAPAALEPEPHHPALSRGSDDARISKSADCLMGRLHWCATCYATVEGEISGPSCDEIAVEISALGTGSASMTSSADRIFGGAGIHCLRF
jgi:hypothetical protein